MVINNSYGPLLYALPLTLADKTYGSAPPEVAASTQGGHVGAEGTEPPIQVKDFGAVSEDPIGHGGASREGAKAREYKSEEEYEFAQPAISRPQRVVWLPE